MSNLKKSYGICIQNCELVDRNSNKREQLRQGDLIRILETAVGEVSSDKVDKIIVKLYINDENKFKPVVYECAKRYVDYVAEPLWMYMIGTNQNLTRMRIYNERDLVLRLKCETEITLNSYKNDSNANIKGVIKLIDPVKEKGFGNFVGLKLKIPPQNRDTLVSLYKMHYDTSTSLLLFRIEVLLDNIKITEQQNSYRNGNYNFKSEFPSLMTLERDVPKSLEIPVLEQTNYMPDFTEVSINSDANSITTTIGSNSYLSTTCNSRQYSITPLQLTDDVLRQQTNYMNPFVSPIITSSSNDDVWSSLKMIPGHVDTCKSETNPITTTNGSSNCFSPIFNARHYPITPPQITLFDHLCNSNSLPSGTDWPGIIKTKRELESENVSYAGNLNQSSSGTISKSSIQMDIKRQINTDNTKQHLMDTGIRSSSIQKNIFNPENSNFAQLVDLPIDMTGAIPKSDGPAAIKRKNGRYNQTKNNNIPKGIEFNKNLMSSANQFQRGGKTRLCQICSNPLELEKLVLKCMHCICAKCFTKYTNLNGTKQVMCVYNRGQNSECKYKLRACELKWLEEQHDKLTFVLPITNNRPTTPKSNGFDDEEEIFECKTERCEGKWFIPKSGSMNLFKCPLCHINNCIHCKVIHDNMTCTEYKNSLKVPVQPRMLQNLTKKLNNFVVSFIPGVGRVAEPQLIPDGASGPNGKETRMKCINKNCTAQWFVLKNDNNTLFKCPMCKLYNCAKCNVIHQNQTCDEYQDAKRTKYMPNFMKRKNPVDNQVINNNRKPITAAKPVVNNFTRRKWTCKRCTFENFSFGYVCELCQQLNNDD